MSLKRIVKRHRSPFIALVVLSGLFILTLGSMFLGGTFQNDVFLSPGTGNPMGLFLFYMLALEVLAIAAIIIFFLIISKNN